MDEVRYYSIRWDGHTHYIGECDRHDLLICVYRGYHNHRTDEITLYPFKPGRAYGVIEKKKIHIRQLLPRQERFKHIK